MVVVCFGDIWWWSFVVTTLLSLVWVGQMPRIPDAPPSFLVPAGRLHPNRSIERDFELFDEFALFAIDKWYQLPAHSSVRKIQRVYQRLVRLSGVWLHFEWSDLEAGKGFVLASSLSGVDPGAGGVYSSAHRGSRVSPSALR